MFGSILSGLGSVVGGLFGSSAAKKDRKAQLAYAQNGIQWRVNDAKKAGIHPLYALGASTPSYTPVGSGGLANGIANAGNAIGAGVDKATAKMDPLAQSQIGVNTAQKDLLVAQRETILNNAKNQALGIAGGVNKLPNPENQETTIQTPGGPIKVSPGTPAQKIEDNVGGFTAELVSLLRVLDGLQKQVTGNEKNPVFFKTKSKNTGTYGRVRRYLKKDRSLGYSRKYGAPYN